MSAQYRYTLGQATTLPAEPASVGQRTCSSQGQAAGAAGDPHGMVRTMGCPLGLGLPGSPETGADPADLLEGAAQEGRALVGAQVPDGVLAALHVMTVMNAEDGEGDGSLGHYFCLEFLDLVTCQLTQLYSI